MLKYCTIETDSEEIKIVRLCSVEPGKNLGVWLEFGCIKDVEYANQSLSWDNLDFIFGKFYKFLKRWQLSKLKPKDKDRYSDIWNILNDDVVYDLIEILDEAVRLGFYTKS